MRFRAPLAREAAHGPRALAMPGNGTRQRPERAGMGAQATGASARPTAWRSSAIRAAPAEPFGMSGNRRGPCRPDHPRLAGRQAKPNQSPRELPAPLGAAQREASAVASGRSLVASQPSARSSRRARPFAASATVPIRKCARGGPVRPIRGRTDVLLLDQGHPACRRAAGPAGARCGRSRGCRRWRARPVRCWRPAGQLQRAGQDGTGAKARADRLTVGPGPAKAERRAPRDHRKPAQDLMRQGLGQDGVVMRLAGRAERQRRQRGAPSRRRPAQADGGHQPETPAVNGADDVLPLAIVPERSPCGADAAGGAGVGHGPQRTSTIRPCRPAARQPAKARAAPGTPVAPAEPLRRNSNFWSSRSKSPKMWIMRKPIAKRRHLHDFFMVRSSIPIAVGP